jgi:hypothetical protein
MAASFLSLEQMSAVYKTELGWSSDYPRRVGYQGQWITIVPELELVVVFNNKFTEGDNFQWSTPERLLTTYIIPAIQ